MFFCASCCLLKIFSADSFLLSPFHTFYIFVFSLLSNYLQYLPPTGTILLKVLIFLCNLVFCLGDVIGREAFGFLVPSSQPEPILGCIFDTSTFKQVWFFGLVLVLRCFIVSSFCPRSTQQNFSQCLTRHSGFFHRLSAHY